jgi:hypothetical protein
MGVRQRCAYMRGHVVRTFKGVFVNRVTLWNKPRQKALQIGLHRRIIIFLDQQACRSMADIEGEQSLSDPTCEHPVANLRGEGIQTFAMGGNNDFMEGLAHTCHCSEYACYTRCMLFLIPHLFPPARLLETAAQDLRLPALETLLTRGTMQTCPEEGVEAALCEALGIRRQQDWPLAPITLEADGWPAEGTHWLRADPVHLRVMRDCIVLTDNKALNLSPQEASALATTIGQHFGKAFNPLPLHPRRWYVPFSFPPCLTTTPLSVATGRVIDPFLPQGDNALRFRTLLNELQMLLFTHPVNQAREALGDLTVNSLWLWGGGTKPAAPVNCMSIYARDSEARALGAFCITPVLAPPPCLERSMLESEGVILLDELTQPGQAGDTFGWRDALGGLEQNWFMPLLASLRIMSPTGLHLLDPVNGKALHVRRMDALKIWKRPRSLTSILA